MKFFGIVLALFSTFTFAEAAKPCFKVNNQAICEARSDCVWYKDKCGDETLNEFADQCLADTTKCTKYQPGIFKRDYPKRYQNTKKCYFESFDPLTEEQCDEVCSELFEQNLQWGPKVQRACKIGCRYSINWHESGRKDPTCMKQCKTTVWNRSKNNKRCNYDDGLGIDVWEINYFGAGIACELGCLIGRERPCQDC